jgi:3-oxoacyl-[acyl-carrier-protein] synthase III
MADDLRNRGAQDRSRISMSEEHEVKYWTEALGVSREQLQRTVDRVGNSAAAVRKELGK